jgi:hypothetical protein
MDTGIVDKFVTDGAGRILDVPIVGAICILLAVVLWWRDKMARQDMADLSKLLRGDLKEEQDAHDQTTEKLRTALLDRLADAQAYGRIGETVREQLKASDASLRQFMDFVEKRERG